MSHNKTTIRDIALVALLAGLIVVQEEALVFLPNIQLTVFLFILYSKKLGLKLTMFILIIYLMIDNLIMSSFSLVFTPFMFIGWAFIPVLLNTVFKKVESDVGLALLAVLFSLLYSWIYIIPNVLIYKVNLVAYLMADVMFEILLAASSLLSTLLLYNVCSKAMDKLIKN